MSLISDVHDLRLVGMTTVIQRGPYVHPLHLPQPFRCPHASVTMSANGSVSGAVPSGSRSRPQARKKPNDDAAYFGPPTASKRHAVDRAEGEPRVKRKRVEPLRKVDRTGVSVDAEEEKSSVRFLVPFKPSLTLSCPDRLQKLTHDHTPSIYLPFQPHTPHKPLTAHTCRPTHACIPRGTHVSEFSRP
jgi:hypothetical protein